MFLQVSKQLTFENVGVHLLQDRDDTFQCHLADDLLLAKADFSRQHTAETEG